MKPFQPRYVTLGNRWIEIPVKILVVDNNAHNVLSAFWQFNKADEVENAGFVAGSISAISVQSFDEALQRFNPVQERIPGGDEIHTLVLNRKKIADITWDDTREIKRLVAGEFDIVLTDLKMYKNDDFDSKKDSYGWQMAIFAALHKNVKAIGIITSDDIDNTAMQEMTNQSTLRINDIPVVIMRAPMTTRAFSGGEYRVKDWMKAVQIMEEGLGVELLQRKT